MSQPTLNKTAKQMHRVILQSRIDDTGKGSWPVMRLVRPLASLKLTLPAMVMLALAIFLSYRREDTSVWWMVVPLTGLSVNLLCAIAVQRSLRTRPALLLFHLCLLALCLLISLSQLCSFRARVELVQGQAFDPRAITVLDQGPWADLQALRAVRFIQGDVRIDYQPALVRVATQSQVHTATSDAAEPFETAIRFGDSQPLRIHRYRFYTTSNKGFAAILDWQPDGAPARRGAVHFPSYPLNDWQQSNRWTTPDGQRLDLELSIERPIAFDRAWTLNESARHWVQGLRVHDVGSPSMAQPRLLRVGESIRLERGTLSYRGTRLWMGYNLVHQPYLDLILVVGVVAVAALGWHFGRVQTRAAPARGRDARSRAHA